MHHLHQVGPIAVGQSQGQAGSPDSFSRQLGLGSLPGCGVIVDEATVHGTGAYPVIVLAAGSLRPVTGGRIVLVGAICLEPQ